jgi:uncharacterized membrane protein HdeD (DUF308 family)
MARLMGEGSVVLSQRLLEGLSGNWWVFVLRGAAAVVFGILSLAWPGVTVAVLVILFGAYALIDGIGSLVSAWRHRGDANHRGHHIGEGVIALLIGIITLVWPGATALALIVLIAIWALLTGIVEISAAIRLRRVISNEWVLGLAGAISVIAGIILLARPGAGALAIAVVIGIYALIFGFSLIWLGLRLRRWRERSSAASAG